jgi:hypothetical protein
VSECGGASKQEYLQSVTGILLSQQKTDDAEGKHQML